MDSLNVDPIQTQREVWLRARIALTERQREYDDGERRLKDGVERAGARVAAEKAKLDELIAARKADFDRYAALPEEEQTPEQARAVDEGALFQVEAAAPAPEDARAGLDVTLAPVRAPALAEAPPS